MEHQAEGPDYRDEGQDRAEAAVLRLKKLLDATGGLRPGRGLGESTGQQVNGAMKEKMTGAGALLGQKG
jgi:hypothetical protein